MSAPFLRRVCHGGPDAIVPRRLVGFLRTTRHGDADGKPQEDDSAPRPSPALACFFSLSHPATPTAASLVEERLAPFLSRSRGSGSSAGILDEYEPEASRGDLVVLRRRHPDWSRRSQRRSDICLYDPMTGDRSFLPDPQNRRREEIRNGVCGDMLLVYSYVLLTAADGIAARSSFQLLAVDFTAAATCDDAGSTYFKVESVSSDAGSEWTYVASAPTHPELRRCELEYCLDQPVVVGGVVHWLMKALTAMNAAGSGHILTYNTGTAAEGYIELPGCQLQFGRTVHLGSSPEGSLRLLVAEQLTVIVWLLSASGGGGWARHAVIDTESTLRSLYPSWRRGRDIVFQCSWESSDAVLLWPVRTTTTSHSVIQNAVGLVVLDLRTKEIRRQINRRWDVLYAVDLLSRLSAMKTY